MQISRYLDRLAVRTPFSETEDLLQIFHGIMDPAKKPDDVNRPVDFFAAALVRKEEKDIWHGDRFLAVSTDEAPPLIIGGGNIGANHGYPCLVRATVVRSGCGDLTPRSVWTDDSGKRWRLIRESGPSVCLFLGEFMEGPLTVSSFPDRISGSLHDARGTLTVIRQTGGVDYVPALHHETCEVDFSADAERVVIRESYRILHPGFDAPSENELGPDLARIENEYRVDPDGRVTVSFAVTNLSAEDLLIEELLGTMVQEKCDLGGGIYRTIPGLLPLTVLCEDGVTRTLDYRHPCPITTAAYPKGAIALTEETFEDPENPPIRQIDEIRDGSGKTVCRFEVGYPSRDRKVSRAWMIVPSRKTYPVYAENFTLSPGETIRGSAYRIYSK